MATTHGDPVEWVDFYNAGGGCAGCNCGSIRCAKFCLERGIATAANVVDHVTPHRGDWNAFVTGELQSLYEPFHKSAKRQIELRGYRRADIGLDGLPTDPNHPFNRAR